MARIVEKSKVVILAKEKDEGKKSQILLGEHLTILFSRWATEETIWRSPWWAALYWAFRSVGRHCLLMIVTSADPILDILCPPSSILFCGASYPTLNRRLSGSVDAWHKQETISALMASCFSNSLFAWAPSFYDKSYRPKKFSLLSYQFTTHQMIPCSFPFLLPGSSSLFSNFALGTKRPESYTTNSAHYRR